MFYRFWSVTWCIVILKKKENVCPETCLHCCFLCRDVLRLVQWEASWRLTKKVILSEIASPLQVEEWRRRRLCWGAVIGLRFAPLYCVHQNEQGQLFDCVHNVPHCTSFTSTVSGQPPPDVRMRPQTTIFTGCLPITLGEWGRICWCVYSRACWVS